MRKTLFLGAGGKTEKLIKFPFLERDEEEEITTLDIVEPADLIFDLSRLHNGERLPFADDEFEQIHAYEVLEHYGMQGNWRGFFMEWTEFHRILKMGGCFALTVPTPNGPQQFGDPGHSRGFNPITFSFLKQLNYENAEGEPRTDYRSVWKGNFVLIEKLVSDKANRIAIALQKQPPIDYTKAPNKEGPPA